MGSKAAPSKEKRRSKRVFIFKNNKTKESPLTREMLVIYLWACMGLKELSFN